MELMERIMEHAQSGYFCSQILMKLLLETVGEENPALVGAAGGLCGGVGFTSNTCGCMTAGACMISYFTGKRAPVHRVSYRAVRRHGVHVRAARGLFPARQALSADHGLHV